MRKESLNFLKRLVATHAPSGREAPLQRVWLDYVKPYADTHFSDAYGNTVAVLNKGGSPRIMIAAHADEIALAVNHIDSDGFVYVRKLGGVDPAISRAQRVSIHTRKGPVLGVVGNVAPHLSKIGGKREVPHAHELFIDIGVSDRKAAQKIVRIGDPVTFNTEFEILRDDLAVSRVFDNRIGGFAIAETARLLKSSRQKLNPEILLVSNTMEEVGLLGARQITHELNPDAAIVIDVTHATDCPTIDKRMHGDVKLGGGPALTHGVGNHAVLVERLEKTAKKKKIDLQHEAASRTTGTDTDVVFITRGGIPSALVSLPNRYMHSPVEMISLTDLEKIPELLAAFLTSVKKGEAFKVKV
ncbi:MAG: ABC transporter ATP-binding protein [Verrucomicrobiales bacterium]|nr:ABC transporter ATP-binding protein [Verrucomicrobiales bacterium]